MGRLRINGFKPEPKESRCIGCGCSDTKTCFKDNQACHWLKVNREKQKGVCSNCREFLNQL